MIPFEDLSNLTSNGVQNIFVAPSSTPQMVFREVLPFENHEIQAPVDPKGIISPMEGSSSTIHEFTKAKTAELKARWPENTDRGNPENMRIVVYQPPQDADPMNMTPNIHVEQVQDKPARSPTTVIDEDMGVIWTSQRTLGGFNDEDETRSAPRKRKASDAECAPI
ncbi:hypothetical protein FF1_009672 [Malus domestica]